jgi:hypothetical protein
MERVGMGMGGFLFGFVTKLVGLALVAVVATAGYAFASSNLGPTSGQGDGAGAISGYVVNDVHYTLGANDATRVSAVSFSLAGAGKPGTVRAALDGDWLSCAPSVTPQHWSCPVPGGVAVADVTELRVVAAQ